MSERHRLRENQLQLNEPLPWDVYDRHNQLLLRKGYVIQRTEQIERLLEEGIYVDASQFRQQAEQSVATKRSFDPLSTWYEIQSALLALGSAPPEDGGFTPRVLNLARSVMELCSKCPDLAVAAITRIEFRRYPLAHSLHVAVLAELIARRGDFDEASRISLISAALTENLAILALQHQLFSQQAPLTPEQREAIFIHPETSARMLEHCGVSDAEWLRAVREHHETTDGKGYPQHSRTPSMLAQIINACDVYAAKITGRAYRKPLASMDAARALYLAMAADDRNPFAALLIKEVGMYPPGTLVRLANGETGVVSRRNPEHANAPQVAVLINSKGLRQMDPVLRDTKASPDYRITAVLPADNPLFSVDFARVWYH